MRVVKFLFACHLVALICGLGSLLIVAPHAEWWNAGSIGGSIFEFALRSAATLHILFGAATMFFFGLLCVGQRKTLLFFAASTLITLSMELFGTSIGFPFGVSSSTILPGVKVAGLVPYSILLSWFYMGFTSYLIANLFTLRLRLRRQTLWSLVLGTYFLTTSDLALNTAMTNVHVSTQLLAWQEYGTYFGMPMRNLVGWTLNGLIFLGVSRLLWRADFDKRHLATWLPLGVYTANTGFAMALNLSIGSWFPALLSALFVLFPESLVLVPGEETHPSRVSRSHAAFSQSIWLLMRSLSLVFARSKLEIHVEGREHLPDSGPVLIAVRHFHWFYDGYMLVRTIPRRLHTIVALDWVQSRTLRLAIELACSLADWPVILRGELLLEHEEGKPWAYTPGEARQYLRQVTLASVRLLRSGEVLVVFPEGYPNIDPHPTPKSDLEAFLPFRPGFVKFVEQAERDGKTRVAIVPTGLSYRRAQGNRWHATVRFGQALFRSDFDNAGQLLRAVEDDVHALSAHTPGEHALLQGETG